MPDLKSVTEFGRTSVFQEISSKYVNDVIPKLSRAWGIPSLCRSYGETLIVFREPIIHNQRKFREFMLMQTGTGDNGIIGYTNNSLNFKIPGFKTQKSKNSNSVRSTGPALQLFRPFSTTPALCSTASMDTCVPISLLTCLEIWKNDRHVGT